MEAILFVILFMLFWVLRSRSKDLQKRLDSLEKMVAGLTAQSTSLGKLNTIADPIKTPDRDENAVQSILAAERVSRTTLDDKSRPENAAQQNSAVAIKPKTSTLVESIQSNWMLWIGGLCVALSGVFLAKYSIEQGLLGPTARITLGIITGLSLHGVAEWLRRKTGESNPSFAALAGGGSITLFAILLAALHMYQMISPASAFVLLTLVALATMVLALIHGPALAAIGLLGAYTVPVFVSDGSGNITFAMLYALVITAAGLLLLRLWIASGFCAVC